MPGSPTSLLPSPLISCDVRGICKSSVPASGIHFHLNKGHAAGSLALRVRASRSVTGHCNDDGSTAGFDVAFEVEDLLPCTEDEGPFVDRDRKLGTHDRRLQMGMAVPVVPGPFVAVIPAGRHKFIENVRQIFDEARFEFDCADGTCAAHVEHMNDTG